MEEFLNDYVQMMAEVREKNLNTSQLQSMMKPSGIYSTVMWMTQ